MSKYYFYLTIAVLTLIVSCKNSTSSKKEIFNIKLLPGHVTNYGGSDGYIDLEVNGGEAPYEFNWSNGETTKDISDLSAGMYKVIVCDEKGEIKSDSIVISQPAENTVADIDGNVYEIVKIGEQWWMAENLRVKHSPDGRTLNSFLYDDNAHNERVYGRLYSWETAMNGDTTNGSQGIAPDGWHIPTAAEWMELMAYCEGHDFAGALLKAEGTTYWQSPNVGATNSTGFTALPGGLLEAGFYLLKGSQAKFLSSTALNDQNNLMFALYYDNKHLCYEAMRKTDAVSIRCIKNKD